MSRSIVAAASAVLALAAPLDAPALAPDAPEPAAPAGFQLSLWDSVQIVDRARSIHGLRLALPYGRNRDLHGADVGIVTRLDGDLAGVQLAAVGLVEGDVTGLQYGWLFSSAGGRVHGVQWSAVNLAGSFEGGQLGLVNYARADSVGAGLALVNVADARVWGAQLGGVNVAARVEGLQLGLVNVTDHLHGVQIGLVNVARNGFLPVFVLFNAAL